MLENKDYVSPEVAKLLKEVGFNEECHCYYDTDNGEAKRYFLRIPQDHNGRNLENIDSAPTLYEAQKWLRNKGWFINVIEDEFFGKWFCSIKRLYGSSSIVMYSDKGSSWEDALNKGIKQGLKYYKLYGKD